MTNPIDLNYSTYWQRFRYHFAIAPLELQLFFAFSLMVSCTLLIIFLFLQSTVYESILPYTDGAFFPYLFIFIHTMDSMARKNMYPPWQRSHLPLIIIMLLFGIFQGYDFLTWNGEDFGNPYLMKNKLQPVWTILIPCFWIAVMLSPRIKKYYQNLRVAYKNI